MEIRRRLVEAYRSGRSGTYEQTAELFGVGTATVSRALRRFRETGDVKYKPRGGNNPRRVDLEWLKEHAEAHPDARLVDRVEAWEQVSGRRVTAATMSNSLQAIAWSYKKNSRRS
jgi:transposase